MFTLILGGARSGKSDLAQRLAESSGEAVVFIATMEPRDDEVRARIEAHRAARPAAWTTVEEPRDVLAALDASAPAGAFVVVDCVTLWLSNLLEGISDGDAGPTGDALDDIATRVEALASWCAAYAGDVAVVSNEVGMGIVPAYPLGRVFRDALGTANRALAARADRVYYTVAGLALELKSLGALPFDAIDAGPHP